MSSWFSAWTGPWTEGPAPPTAPAINEEAGSPRYRLGEVVEYFSASQGSWIPARVIAVNSSGTYDLDCKPAVPVEKIRSSSDARQSRHGAALPEFAVGDIVEYFSVSQGDWIPAKVLSVNQTGTYNLDCKPDVTPDRVRARRQAAMTMSPNARAAGQNATLQSVGTVLKLDKVEDLPAPVQLLRVQRAGNKWVYELCPQGCHALERYGQRHIAVVSVCGQCRSGKSFLLNLLLERVQKGLPQFQVGSSTRACTEGIWLFGSTDSDDEASPLLAFLDCEGFGSTESDRIRDAQLMTLCALLSSVMVLNIRGTLNENTFNSLALVGRFAEQIEEMGQAASRPALFWVLRDFMLELRDAAGNIMTPDEYLEQALHAAPIVGHDARGQGARDVRQSLLQFFSQRSCSTLVQPHIEEAQLQDLGSIPYKSLRAEFRAGVEAMRTQLVATCHLNPKAIGGQPLSCAAFVALTKHLVESLNDAKHLSIKSAWDAVQHTTCGSLAEELRGMASQKLKAMKSGQKLPDGTQLPMTDEALRAHFREQRHALKVHWEKQAVGDEDVRKEYWQELKETLAREELQIRQQNGRMAEQLLSEKLKTWQEWLDDSSGHSEAGERISVELGQVMERVPATALTRSARAALEAAARRVAAARTAVAATVEHSAEARRRALAWGEKAVETEGAVRSELEATKASMLEALDRQRQAQQSAGSKAVELQSKCAELEDCQSQFQAALADLEQASARETELQAQCKVGQEREAQLRQDLEAARAVACKAEADMHTSKRRIEEKAESAKTLGVQLQEELRQAQAELQRQKARLAEETAALKGEHDQIRAEHQQRAEELCKSMDSERHVLSTAHEKTHDDHQKLLATVRSELDEMRKKHTETKEGTKGQLLEHVRTIGTLEGKVTGLGAEAEKLRLRIAELQSTVRRSDAEKLQHSQDCAELRSKLEQCRISVVQAKAQGEESLAKLQKEGQKRLQDRVVKLQLQPMKKGCVPFQLAKGKAKPRAGSE